MDKSYVTLGDDGSVSDTSIGDPLDDGSGANSDGWISVASGELNIDLSRERDADGATLVPLTSTNNNNLFNNNGYEGITIPPSSIKSIYIKLSSLVLQVQETDLEGSSFEGETMDELAVVEGGVQLYVGRGIVCLSTASVSNHNLSVSYHKVIFEDWELLPITPEVFTIFYSPRRFLGKVWTPLSTCAPSASPTERQNTSPPTMLESVKVSSNMIDITMGGSGRRLNEATSIAEDSNTRSLQGSGCFDRDQVYP
eukprot:scaffold13375_cov216-Alexandrium_tamarense.AAC.1